MRYNTLKNGFRISEVSFGCMSLKSNAAGNDTLIGTAINEGITLFDTADLYEKGENERLLGKALKSRRNEVLISTKVGNRWRTDGSGWDWCPDKKYILSAVDASLKRLQTDHIDLYLLHGGTMEDPIDETIEAFERLVNSGKIRSYGLSSIRPNVIVEYVNRSNIAAVMTQYSLLDLRPEEQTLSLLQEAGMGVLARGTVAGGLLAGKPAADYIGMPKDKIQAMLDGLQKNLQEGRTLQETAMRYVIDNPTITTAVAGIRTQEQLSETIKAADSPIMEYKERNLLASLWEANRYSEHR